MELVALDHAEVFDSTLPFNLKLAIHRLILKDALVDGGPLLVPAFVPLVILKGAIEPALSACLQVLYFTLGHVSLIEEAFKFGLTIWEVECAFSMALIHLIDLTFVRGAIAVSDALHWKVFEGISFAASWALLAGTRTSIRRSNRRLSVLILSWLRTFRIPPNWTLCIFSIN